MIQLENTQSDTEKRKLPLVDVDAELRRFEAEERAGREEFAIPATEIEQSHGSAAELPRQLLDANHVGHP